MAVSGWSTTAGSNASVGGVSIAEGWASADINNAIRAVMADVRAWYNATWPYETLSTDKADFDADDSGKFFAVSAASGAITLTLPVASVAGAGRMLAFVKSDSTANAVIVDGDGAETINGVATLRLYRQYDYVVLVCTGAAWLVVADGRTAPAWCVTMSADHTTDTSVLPFDTEALDSAAAYNATTFRFVAPIAGLYRMAVTLLSGDSDSVVATLRINATAVSTMVSPAVAGVRLMTSTQYESALAVGDYVDVYLVSGDVDAAYGGVAGSVFSGHLVR